MAFTPATLQNPLAASLINNMCWMSTFSVRHYSYYPDFKGSGKDRVLLHYFKVKVPKPTLEMPLISATDVESLKLSI
jgi:hypothetical protein